MIFERLRISIVWISKIFNVGKINYILQDVDSCLKLSDFPEHPKNPTNKLHLLKCGKLKGFFDISLNTDVRL